MSVMLKMEPNTPPVSWRDFTRHYRANSVALDGFVYGPPRWTQKEEGSYATFNHHEGLDRYATRATCAQVLMAIRMGMFDELFRDKTGNLHMEVPCNDCDEDVCLSFFQLSHYEIVRNPVNPLINRLVHMEDMLDATAGAYIYPTEGKILRELAWIFEPYHMIRLNGGLGRRNPSEFEMVVEDVGRRIMAHITDSGKSIDLDTSYNLIDKHGPFVVIDEVGAQCRNKVYSDGARSFLAVKQRPNGVYDYKLGKMSPYILLDVIEAMKKLNDAEGLTANPDKWGGGDTIGGSPRIAGSKLEPKEVVEIIMSTMAEPALA